MVAAEILGGLSGLKTAFDIAKGLKDIDDAARRNAAVIELQEKILAAQQTQAILVQQVGDLENELAELEAWDADKERYHLIQIQPGVTAYALQKGMENGEPPHYLCPNCYTNNKKKFFNLSSELRVARLCWFVIIVA